MCNFCTMEGLDSCKLMGVMALDLGTVKDFLQIQLWLEKNNDDEFFINE